MTFIHIQFWASRVDKVFSIIPMDWLPSMVEKLLMRHPVKIHSSCIGTDRLSFRRHFASASYTYKQNIEDVKKVVGIRQELGSSICIFKIHIGHYKWLFLLLNAVFFFLLVEVCPELGFNLVQAETIMESHIN